MSEYEHDDGSRVIKPATGGGIMLDDRAFQLEDVDQLTRALVAKSEGRLEHLQRATRDIEAKLKQQTDETKSRIARAFEIAQQQIDERVKATAEKSAEILEARHREGYQKGYDEGLADGQSRGFTNGYSEGLEKGLIEGRNDGRRLGEEAARTDIKERFDTASEHAIKLLGDLSERLDADWARAVTSAKDGLIDLALSIARRIVEHEIESAPGEIVETCRQAIERIETQPPLRLTVHPLDREFVDEWAADWASTTLGGASVELNEDATVGRGGCRVESPAASVDASIDGRLETLANSVRNAGGLE